MIDDDWTAYGGGTWEYLGRFDGESYNSGLPIPAYRGTLTIFRHGTDEYGRSCEGTYVEEDYRVIACYSDHEPYCTNAGSCP